MRAILVPTDRIAGGDVGPAPMLQWLKIDDLVVDDGYQRDLKRENWTVIRRIAASFKWSRFSPVFVAPVEGGRFAIIDGQHRTHAAALRGFDSVPCQVVPMTLEEQAEAFAAVNGTVTRITLWNIYRASLAARIDWAIGIQSAALAAGCSVMESNASTALKKPGEIYAIDGFRKAVEKFGQPVIIKALAMLRHCRAWEDEAVYWEANILFPVIHALCRRPEVLDRPELQAEFGMWPLWRHIDEIADSAKKALRAGTDFTPKREQLEQRLAHWLHDTFAPQKIERTAERAIVAVPTPKPSAAALAGPVIGDEQRRQLQEAAARRARLGL